jgi:magnesium chelatase subunit I
MATHTTAACRDWATWCLKILKRTEEKISNLRMKDYLNIKTLGQLKAAGYQSKSIKEELRTNLIQKLRNKEKVFEGIWGYEETVIPDLERALLAGHDINLLGLRGQAKTRLARLMIKLLDEHIPVIAGSDLNDDPLRPISRYGHDTIQQLGDATPIAWLPRDERYTEKLATPDVSIADLIGDVDPIKAASLKLPYSDERVIHFGLIPRSHRCIFVINELPDLQARIQVALFNILQEGDIQIRGFKLRLPLDLQFVFTANPEDYTNRGSIVTPLKDRIDSQIITHYPKTIEIGKKITQQEAQLKDEQKKLVSYNEIVSDLVEQISFEARKSEYVDPKSGVSARLTISAFENLVAAAERRCIINNEKNTAIRISDFVGVIPAITGKVELVYEGEQEGPGIVAQNLIGKAIRTQFVTYFPDPDKFRKQKEKSPYKGISDWFGDGNTVDLLHDMSNADFEKALKSVPGLSDLVNEYQKGKDQATKLFFMEFALHGLAEFSLISKHNLTAGHQFKDLLSSMFTLPKQHDEDDDEDDEEAFGGRRRI